MTEVLDEQGLVKPMIRSDQLDADFGLVLVILGKPNEFVENVLVTLGLDEKYETLKEVQQKPEPEAVVVDDDVVHKHFHNFLL